MHTNPFTPNFGQVPYYMAGREFLVDEMVSAFEAGAGHPALTSLLLGARGTGKTALLSRLAAEAGQYGWLSVNVACLKGMLEDVLQQSAYAAEHLLKPQSGRKLKGISIAQIFSAEWENIDSREPNWRLQMSALLDQLAEQGTGLLITVDEVDPELDEMIQLASVHQLFIREGRKVALLMAGLPARITRLVSDKSVSFLRRASRYQLGMVADHEVSRAFVKTIEAGGKAIDSDALDLAVASAQGFPYMIQLIGFRSWQEAGDAGVVTAEHVRTGSALAFKDMEHRVLRATLDELSPGDLAFLTAMLEDSRASSAADLGQRLGKSPSYIARYRKRLADQGAVTVRPRGQIAFGLPGLREYLPAYLEEFGS